MASICPYTSAQACSAMSNGYATTMIGAVHSATNSDRALYIIATVATRQSALQMVSHGLEAGLEERLTQCRQTILTLDMESISAVRHQPQSVVFV
jgi:hypothetical protein